MGQEIEDMHRWQQEIEKGLLEAEAGDFASEEEVQAVFAKLTNFEAQHSTSSDKVGGAGGAHPTTEKSSILNVNNQNCPDKSVR